MEQSIKRRTEKKIYKRVNLSLMGKTDLNLNFLCEENGRSRSNMISVLINKEFNRLEEEKN